jgi:leader peptidase (prepilin peptidase)/N-methyltransferase
MPFVPLLFAVLGALIGSFANVVIYRLPRRQSIIFPGSHCPRCQHRLGVIDLIPILSWLLLLGRCRYCQAAISARYPLVEMLMAGGFVLLALRWPLASYGVTVLPLLPLLAMLVMLALIDIDQQLLPDSLTLPGTALAVLATLLYAPGSGLPNFYEAVFGASLGAGVIVLINRLGGLALRRFGDTKERLGPIGMDQVNLAALAGAVGGWLWGLGLALAGALANAVTGRVLRFPEGPLYGLWLLALALMSGLGRPLEALSGSLAAAGAVAVLGALYWWLREWGRPPAPEPPPDNEEPIAMGFGDVKLAALLGAMLGWQNLLLALFLAFVLGAVGGLLGRALGGGRQIPFGPYLALGGLFSLFFGSSLIAWYLGLLGL